MALTISLFIVFLICMSMLWTEGLWGNVLTFVNVVFAGIIAVNFYQPVADLLDDQLPSFTYLWDFLSIWLLFALAFSLLRLMTDYLSKWRVRFLKPIETAGNLTFAVLVAMQMVSFTSFTLHMAPLAERPFGGVSISNPNALNVMPGTMWVRFVDYTSNERYGALSHPWGRSFNGQAFFTYYNQRRRNLDQIEGFRVQR